MREILFRGKTYGCCDWKYGSYVKQYGADMIYLPDGVDREYGLDCYHIIPETLGQYTGLTDKNGTKIFEGDIVKVEYTGVNKGVNGIAEVVFKDCQFALVWGWHKETVCLTHFCHVTFEVIGNIHDDPELLEKEDVK
jgi:hypothetical protein